MATDNFNRANGALGANWTNHNLGDLTTGLTIVSNQVKGTGAGVNGNIWTANTFGDDQFSEVTVTATAMTTWIAATVRAQASGPCYLVLYFNSSGTYKIQLFYSPVAGTFTMLNSGAASINLPGALVAGDKVKIQAVGRCVSALVNGVEKLSFYDTNVPSGGGPGIAVAGSADLLDNWTGGAQAGDLHLVSTDGNGVESYTQVSRYNPGSSVTLVLHKTRVKRPNTPAVGKAHNFLYILPVTVEGDTSFGDATNYIRGLGAQDTYNVTLIEPSFQIEPWYANHATDPDKQYESFVVLELKPWVTANLATSGTERHWVIGFSKSGYGGTTMLFRNPTLFDVAAFWDFPAQGFTAMGQFANDNLNYGTDANFQANYRMTDTFLNTYKTQFQTKNRIWMSGYNLYKSDDDALDTKLTSLSVQHTYATPGSATHAWTSGWVPGALAGLDTLSRAMDAPPYPIGLTSASLGVVGAYQKHFA